MKTNPAIAEIPASTRAAHTPGPWTFKKGAHRIEVRTTPERAYAFSLPDEANARLIASAPDLIEALAGCADALREAGKDFAQANRLAVRPNLYELHERAARAAIAKAKGGAQ